MKISIVTPVFNDRRVARALDSILAQQHEHDLELIVIDAGSTDGTLDILDTYKDRISVLVNEPDEGIYDGMNKGIRKATGDVVGILNADDYYSDPFVLRDVQNAFHHEDTDVCYGDLVYTNDAGDVVRYWKAGETRRMKWYAGWMPPHPTVFVRRRVYERYGTFDLRYAIAADYELLLRFLWKHHLKVNYVKRVLVHMAPGGTSTRSVSAIIQANIEVARACWHNAMYGGILVPLLKPAQKILQFIRRPPQKRERPVRERAA